MIKNLIPQWLKNYYHLLLATLAVIWFGYPAKKLIVIGVTGTDGKTTTSTLIYQILKTAGEKVALISTVAAYIGNEQIDTGFHVTTPNPWRLQELIKMVASSGCKYLVLEVTSMGIDQWRVFGTNINCAVLTNVTHEHLDYHGTFANYLQTKARIFRKVKYAVLNKSDASYKTIKSNVGENTTVIPYDNKTLKKDLQEAVAKRFKEIYNQFNATAAILASQIFVKDEKSIVKAIQNFEGVPGRMEEIPNKKRLKIIVDYAHTPNALKNVLEFLSHEKNKNSRLIAVFGCTGERDFEKRPLMGSISAKIADVSVFTADDPRNEDVAGVISQIVAGAVKSGAKEITGENIKTGINTSKHLFIRLPDRKEAIDTAINKIARPGDVVVVAGMGHQTHIAIGDKEIPWNDKNAIKNVLN